MKKVFLVLALVAAYGVSIAMSSVEIVPVTDTQITIVADDNVTPEGEKEKEKAKKAEGCSGSKTAAKAEGCSGSKTAAKAEGCSGSKTAAKSDCGSKSTATAQK